MNAICTYRPAPTPLPALSPTVTSYPAVLQEWEESERGWGVRPDGATLHLTQTDRDIYVDGFNKEFNPPMDEAPDEYRRVSGPPRNIRVTPAAYAALIRQQLDGKTLDASTWPRHGLRLEIGMLVMLKRGEPR